VIEGKGETGPVIRERGKEGVGENVILYFLA
jgi:hypothetical protein